jgi:tetratricopeptide (TPR) repeat protein
VQVLHALSRIYQDLADHETSERLLQQALTALPAAPADARGAATVVETLTRLGDLARLRGRYKQAEVYLRRALTIAAAHPDRAVAAAGARNALAITFKDSGRYDEAAALYRDVLSEVVARLVPTRRRWQPATTILRAWPYARGDYRAAEPLARHAVRLRARRFGAHHRDVAADLAVLAAVLLGEHRLDEAERAYRQALGIHTRVFGSEHYEVAVVLNGLATIEVERGRPVQAEPLYRRALAIKERVLGPEHPEIGVLLNNLAVMHRKAGQIDAAAACYRQALPLLTRSLGDQHPSVLTCSDNLAALFEPTAQPSAAAPRTGRACRHMICLAAVLSRALVTALHVPWPLCPGPSRHA